jgi:hypothetical protein
MPKKKKRQKCYFILIKRAIHQEKIMPNVGSPNFIKHKILDLKMQINPCTVLIRDLNIPLSPKDRLCR